MGQVRRRHPCRRRSLLPPDPQSKRHIAPNLGIRTLGTFLQHYWLVLVHVIGMLRLMRAGIVDDEMDIEIVRDLCFHCIEELAELLRAMPPEAAADHLPDLHVKGSEQRDLARPFIIVCAARLAPAASAITAGSGGAPESVTFHRYTAPPLDPVGRDTVRQCRALSRRTADRSTA